MCFAPKSFSLPQSVLDKSKARFGRLQNSPSAQTVAIAHPALRQDLFAQTLLTATQKDILVQNTMGGQEKKGTTVSNLSTSLKRGSYNYSLMFILMKLFM